eukprot:CAMPEP_0116825128 /NCGR_PEP_ID=MMETSP0418-20121206/1786_1 /TAXON_ID=1158023 /ORGANISM="Astrosyne radiata, Strain 13vi08-1A" /LENGTH=186 /DNA_ID=CAMNT_0004453587 /DNA_START=11 /DNA_END=571 /DNA_ORIENTATION=-
MVLSADPRLLGVGVMITGVLCSEMVRRPRSIHGIFSWTILMAFVVVGYLWSDRLRNRSMVPSTLTLVVCLVVSVLGWYLRCSAVIALGEAFNLKFTESGAITKGKIVTSGPYAIIRHPGYASFPLTTVSASIISSMSLQYGLYVLALVVLVYTKMMLHEESRLMKASPEYKEYCEKVRYRVIPHVF